MSSRADILIVEPGARRRASFERLLLGGGHRVAVVATRQAALHHLQHHRADVIVVGPGIGAGDDLLLLGTLRERTTLLELPVLVVVPAQGEARRAQLLREGATDVVVEPRAGARLLAHVDRLFELRQIHPHGIPEPTASGPTVAFYCRECRVGLRHRDRACPHCRALAPEGGWPSIASSRFVDLGCTVEGRYRLEQVVGEGRIGVVYRATELESLAWHAIKVIDLSSDPHRPSDAGLHARVAREVQALLALRTPHVARIYDFCMVRPGVVGLVMDFIAGRSLFDHLEAQGPLSLGVALDVFDQVGHALAEAHELGMVHRDLKPDNILLKRAERGEEFFATLLDFGLVEILGFGGEGDGERGFFGSLTWTSPEQLRPGQPVDHRADLYSFGAVLFHAVAGSPPFPASHPAAMLSQHLKAPIPRLTERLGRPGEERLEPLDELIGWLMQKSPEQRPGSMREVLGEFSRIRQRWRQTDVQRNRVQLLGRGKESGEGSA